MRRFTLHILPGRFVKIRRYGIHNHTARRNLKLQVIPEQNPDIDTLVERKEPPDTNLKRFQRITGSDLYRCAACKKGMMEMGLGVFVFGAGFFVVAGWTIRSKMKCRAEGKDCCSSYAKAPEDEVVAG